MTMTMTSTKALEIDKKHGTFYADWDDESGSWCVFGSESGFAYASYGSEDEALDESDRMAIQYGTWLPSISRRGLVARPMQTNK